MSSAAAAAAIASVGGQGHSSDLAKPEKMSTVCDLSIVYRIWLSERLDSCGHTPQAHGVRQAAAREEMALRSSAKHALHVAAKALPCTFEPGLSGLRVCGMLHSRLNCVPNTFQHSRDPSTG